MTEFSNQGYKEQVRAREEERIKQLQQYFINLLKNKETELVRGEGTRVLRALTNALERTHPKSAAPRDIEAWIDACITKNELAANDKLEAIDALSPEHADIQEVSKTPFDLALHDVGIQLAREWPAGIQADILQELLLSHATSPAPGWQYYQQWIDTLAEQGAISFASHTRSDYLNVAHELFGRVQNVVDIYADAGPDAGRAALADIAKRRAA